MRMMKFFAVAVMWVLLCSISWGYDWSTNPGDGTALNPYQISTSEQLASIGHNPDLMNKHFKLMNDINLSDYTGTEFNVIGSWSEPFRGVFDGCGYIIHNFSYESSNEDCIGLFGTVSSKEEENYIIEIKNIVLMNPVICGGTIDSVGSLIGRINDFGYIRVTNCHAHGVSVSGNNMVGGLIGAIYYTYLNDAVISNCSVDGKVVGNENIGGLMGYEYFGIIVNSRASCIVEGTAFIGGLVGCNVEASILHSSAAGIVTGGSFVGGLAGYCPDFYTMPMISNCYTIASVQGADFVGGFIGISGGVVENSISTGIVTGTSNVGGFIGRYDSGPLTKCFWDQTVNSLLPGIGNISDPNVIGKTTAEMKTLATYTSSGWDFTNETANGANDYWRMCAEGSDYPRLNWESIDGDFVCPDGVSVEDLDYFVGRWMLSSCTSSNNYCSGADVNVSGNVDLADFAVLAGHWLEGI